MDNPSNNQADYFDVETNRYPVGNILTYSYAQYLELKDLQNNLNLPKGSSIIDFGCGSGRVSFFLLQRGYNVVGVDISRKSLDALNGLYKKYRTGDWGKLTVRTSLPDDLVDGVVGADVLHHVTVDEVLPELFERVRDGGRISFSEPNAMHLLWYIHYFLEKEPWAIEKGILQCTRRNMSLQLENAGWKNILVKGHGLVPTKWLNSWKRGCEVNALRLGTSPLIKQLCFRFIISAEK